MFMMTGVITVSVMFLMFLMIVMIFMLFGVFGIIWLSHGMIAPVGCVFKKDRWNRFCVSPQLNGWKSGNRER
jgi:hypothetical protein